MNVASFVLAAITFLGGVPPAANHDRIVPPDVPADLNVSSLEKAFAMAHAIGTQNYSCLPMAAGGFDWVLFGPQATLFDGDDDQVMTHFLSTNPAEGLARATWQHSRDTSRVWAALVKSSTDPAYVAPGAIAWFLLRTVGTEYGPDYGGKLVRTTAIQRVNTAGGVAPATGCATSTDVGKKALVPYEADYVFYRMRQ